MNRDRIDIHHHIAPPAWLAEMDDVPQPLTTWSIRQSLDDMDAAGVGSAITSVTTPGVWAGAAPPGRRMARLCNEYAATLAMEYPGRFGFFAALPLPDAEGSLLEIEYAFDHLQADGVCLFTSYDDAWLGSLAFDEVMFELNRRHAIIYTHPLAPMCCRGLVDGVKDAVIEYGADTTRAIAGILFALIPARFPNLTWIFSHGGGVLPMVQERLLRQAAVSGKPDLSPATMGEAIASFYYDVAQVSNPIALAALTRMVPTSQILFGSDFPFRSASEYAPALVAFGLADSALRAIERENALRLFGKRLPATRKDSPANTSLRV